MTISSFYAHRNGVDQPGIVNDLYAPVLMTTLKFDTTGGWDFTYGVWRPGRAGIVHFSAQLWIRGVAPNGFTNLAKFVKNGPLPITGDVPGWNDVFTGATGSPGNGYPWIQINGVDQCDAQDYYGLVVYDDVNGVGEQSIDGNMAHTFWSCLFFHDQESEV